MDTHIDTLNTLYNSVLQSPSESVFYEDTHRYIDYIVKTPTLAGIIDTSADYYSREHRKIWGKEKCATDEEADKKEEATHRLEKFSLYADDYVSLHSRIYLWLEEYKNHTEPDERPYPAAIVMLRGVHGIGTELWSKKTIAMYGRQYVGKRKEYENKLRHFHTIFILELGKISREKIRPVPTDTVVSTKIRIMVSDKKGIYRADDEKKFYGIRKITKRMRLIKHLAAKDNCNITELEHLTNQTTDVTIKSIVEINRLFRQKLGLTDDLIVRRNTGGYSLNKDVFEVEISSNL